MAVWSPVPFCVPSGWALLGALTHGVPFSFIAHSASAYESLQIMGGFGDRSARSIMKHPLPLMFALTALAVLLGTGSMFNSACKTSSHAWCDPTFKIRQGATRSHEGDNMTGHAVSHVSSLSRR